MILNFRKSNYKIRTSKINKRNSRIKKVKEIHYLVENQYLEILEVAEQDYFHLPINQTEQAYLGQ